jgi:hypothetical protein
MKKFLILFIYFTLFSQVTFAWVNSNLYKNSIKYRLEKELPSNIKNYAWVYINDLDFWKSSLDTKDKNLNEYIVIPSKWLVVPIIHIPKNFPDYELMIKNEDVNLNDYLRKWAIIYPNRNTEEFSKWWNKVIFGHSSYWKNFPWRYKTQFQLIIWLEVWKEIWIYKRDKSWYYTRYKYKINESYNTKPTDLEILQQVSENRITLFTCTPIWWISGRWVVKASIINEKNYPLNDKMKTINNKIIKKINSIKSPNSKNKFILKLNYLLYRLKDRNLIFSDYYKYFKDKFWVNYLL